MACEQPISIYVGQTKRLTLAFADADGERIDLTTATAIELQVKAADGDADPALIALSIGDGITVRPQVGDDIGMADAVISSARTTAAPWPDAPASVGIFRYDVVLEISGDRHYAVPPSDFVVRSVVNGA